MSQGICQMILDGNCWIFLVNFLLETSSYNNAINPTAGYYPRRRCPVAYHFIQSCICVDEIFQGSFINGVFTNNFVLRKGVLRACFN